MIVSPKIALKLPFLVQREKIVKDGFLKTKLVKNVKNSFQKLRPLKLQDVSTLLKK